MQTRTCPLCGLAAPDADDHATRAHSTTLEAAEELLAEGRRKTADQLERHARSEHGQRIARLGEGPDRQPGAAIDGGYL